MTKKSILVIALSARPFVAAAKKAGYSVISIDAFADQETTALADKTFVVDFDAHGFTKTQLLEIVQSLVLDDYIGFVYGSGLEAEPALLQSLAMVLPLIGNSAKCVAAVKTASTFFAALDELNINYPATYFSKPADTDTQNYLVKFAGGCGGTHIQTCDSHSLNVASKNHYFQQYIKGHSVSVLFLAFKNTVSVIGFNEQLISESNSAPFRYGGAVSNIDLPQQVKKQLIEIAEKLTIQFELVGLNSIDVIVQNEMVYVLEINPRLSATVDLYTSDMPELFAAHLQACTSPNLPMTLCLPAKQLNAHAIVYAPQALQVANTLHWPDWVVDIPISEQAIMNIKLDAPICTVLASAETSESAKQLVQSRVKILLETLVNHSISHHHAR